MVPHSSPKLKLGSPAYQADSLSLCYQGSPFFSAANAILKVKIPFLVLVNKNISPLSLTNYLDSQLGLLLRQIV